MDAKNDPVRSVYVRLSLLTVLLLPAQGCYSAVRVDPSDVQPGNDLSLHLTNDGVEHLRRFSDRVGDEVAGELRSRTADSITVWTRLRQPSTSVRETERLRQAITFSLEDVREVTVPELNKGRTAGIVLAGVVLVGYVLADVLNFGSADTRTPDPPDPSPFMIVPFW